MNVAQISIAQAVESNKVGKSENENVFKKNNLQLLFALLCSLFNFT